MAERLWQRGYTERLYKNLQRAKMKIRRIIINSSHPLSIHGSIIILMPVLQRVANVML